MNDPIVSAFIFGSISVLVVALGWFLKQLPSDFKEALGKFAQEFKENFKELNASIKKLDGTISTLDKNQALHEQTLENHAQLIDQHTRELEEIRRAPRCTMPQECPAPGSVYFQRRAKAGESEG